MWLFNLIFVLSTKKKSEISFFTLYYLSLTKILNDYTTSDYTLLIGYMKWKGSLYIILSSIVSYRKMIRYKSNDHKGDKWKGIIIHVIIASIY